MATRKRYTYLTADRRKAIVASLRAGATYEEAARAADVSLRHLFEHRRKDGDWDAECRAARAEGQERTDEVWLAGVAPLAREGFVKRKRVWEFTPDGERVLVSETEETVPIPGLILRRAERADPERYGVPAEGGDERGTDPELARQMREAAGGPADAPEE